MRKEKGRWKVLSSGVAADERATTLSVADDGPGFATAESDLPFKRFYRPDSAPQGGAGLGLAIVKEIADRYGGKVTIASRPQVEGTRVEVVFPNAHLRS